MSEQPVISLLGSTALLFEAPGALALVPQQHLWNLALQAAQWPEIDEAVPGMNNLMIVFDPLRLAPEALEQAILHCWRTVVADAISGRTIDVPVTYGGAKGEDLAGFAAAKGMSVEALVAAHVAPLYSVAAVGAMPGFVYLSGLDPRLAMPRRANPRMKVEEGSVIIGGAQAGIMPLTAPSGWHILGHTDFSLFDPMKDQPAAFRPGDRIRFTVREIVA